MTKQKYAKGTRVRVKRGHEILETREGKLRSTDIRPELKDDIATVMYSYAEFYGHLGRGEDQYKSYCLKFDKYGAISWFREDNLILYKEPMSKQLKTFILFIVLTTIYIACSAIFIGVVTKELPVGLSNKFVFEVILVSVLFFSLLSGILGYIAYKRIIKIWT